MTNSIPRTPENFDFHHRDLLSEFMNEFDIGKDDICLIGSMPLHVFGIRENKDVDIIAKEEVRKRVYQKASDHADCITTPDGQIYYGPNDYIEIGPHDRFDYLGITNDELVENDDFHMSVDGFKVMRLELAVSKKYAEGRPKDMEDIDALERADVVNTIDWDWDLVRFVPPWEEINEESLFERGMYSLRFRGLQETIKIALYYFSSSSSLAARFHNTFQTVSHWRTYRGIVNLRNQGLTLEMPVASIIANHYNEGEFTGWDIIVACLEQAETGTSEVIIGSDGTIRGGEVDLASQMLDDEFSVSVSIGGGNREPVTLSSALKNTEYSKEELVDAKNKLFNKNGVYFHSILWPSAKEQFDEIEEWLNNRVTVIESDDYQIPSDKFPEFVHRIYDLDERSREWVIEKKIRELRPDDGRIRVLTLEVPDPQFGKGVNPVPYSRKIRSMKRECRKAFSGKIEQYTYDNIIHTTDNFDHNHKVKEIIHRYTKQ